MMLEGTVERPDNLAAGRILTKTLPGYVYRRYVSATIAM